MSSLLDFSMDTANVGEVDIMKVAGPEDVIYCIEI